MKRAGILLALAGLLLASGAVLAQTGGPYDLSWTSVDGGGRTFSSAGPYVLGATMGQPDAGRFAGGPYILRGGFWNGGIVPAGHRTYLPLVLRQR
jgi:hypothetical protein